MRSRESSLSLYQVRLVSSVTLKTCAVRRDAVDAHAGDRDDQVLVPVELHAERPPADMGEHLAGLEIRARETNDVAVAGRAIEPVLAIEDDILGSLDLIKADRLRVDQPVVLGVGRIGSRGCTDGAGASAT